MNHQFQNRGYGGPWAFATLGSAGGQTVVGALNTGTHGGDFNRPPIADSVLAIHLVADGGKHYWIESVSNDHPQLTDDFMMSIEFGTTELGGIGNFKVIRDHNTFNAVLVSSGRYGVIYSVVLMAVPQYSMYERRRPDQGPQQHSLQRWSDPSRTRGVYTVHRSRGGTTISADSGLPHPTPEFPAKPCGRHQAMGPYAPRRPTRPEGTSGRCHRR